MKTQKTIPLSRQEKINLTTKAVFIWTLLWVMSIALLAFGPKFIWHYNIVITTTLVLINIILGIVMIIATNSNIQSLDELHQKIQYDAIAISLGGGFIFGSIYPLLHSSKLIAFAPQVSHLIILMALIYIIAIVYGMVKYK